MSFLGHSDIRLDLDKDIKREDARYYPALSIMASKLAYENEAFIKSAVTNRWEMEFVGFYNFYNEFQHKSTTQAFIFQPLSYYTIREKLKEMLASNKNAKFIVTGHSLGAALAILFPSILALHGEKELLDRLEAVYTYGQPRVGDEDFGLFMKNCLRRHNIKYYRIVYRYDIVAKLPFDNTLMTFKHFGKSLHFNSLYHGKVSMHIYYHSFDIIQHFLCCFKITLFRNFFMRYPRPQPSA
ncbi:triacylglycerol lipase OBL1-like isoform X2 [Amaranthus tricolor]|nr:triacylglycerol lipase OBL1-like isoform X2 [Amaranthus tricolor]